MFLFYGHVNSAEWESTWTDNLLNNGTSAKNEMNSLQAYLTNLKGISGLILKNINLYVSMNTYYKFYN